MGRGWGFIGAMFALPLMAQGLLTDPMLQNPTPHSIDVVWFTEFEEGSHYVEYGEKLDRKVVAQTKKLTRMREDGLSVPVYRSIYRHEATLTDLPAFRIPYRVVSMGPDEQPIKSEIYSCAPAPKPGIPLKILFTSDHQVKPMVAANLQKVKEAFPDIDAIFYAGDCVDHPDKASEWFDEPKGGGFFCLFARKGKKKARRYDLFRGSFASNCSDVLCNRKSRGHGPMEHGKISRFSIQ
jgi:hypothetical protein